jgi:predicted acyl esterase
MVPFITWADPFNGFLYRGGAFELGVQAWWYMLMGYDTLMRRYRDHPEALKHAIIDLVQENNALGHAGYRSLPLAEFAPLRRHQLGATFFDDMAKPYERGQFMPRTILGKHAAVQVPTLNVGGWYDIFLADTITNYQAMRDLGRPAKLLIGPWSHGQQGNVVGM